MTMQDAQGFHFIRSSSGGHRLCFCGAQPQEYIPGTSYVYCETHAREVRDCYARWYQEGGRSRFDEAA